MDEKRLLKRKEKALSESNREQLAVSCKHLGDYFNQQGKYQNAVKEYQQEAELYAKMGKKLEMAKAERMIGEMFMLLAEFDNAKEHINIYLKIAKKLQNKVEEQRAYATLGRAHLLHGQSASETSTSIAVEQLKQAEKAFLKSLLLIKELTGQISKLEQLDMQARCYLNIGVVKEHMEEFEESIAYIEKAIKISKSHDIFELTHLCYISMSLLYNWKKNDSTVALRYCNLALQVAKRLPNRVKKICETLITKSEILIKCGDFASAKQILTKAYKKNTPDENDRNVIEKTLRIVVKICQTLDELVTASSDDFEQRKKLYERLGDGCCHLQNYAQALEYYQKMLECALQNAETGKSLIPIYVSLYQTYKDNKQYERALEYLWKEYELNKHEPAEAFATLCSIAEVCETQMQPFWTIQDIYQKAKEQATKAADENTCRRLEKIVYIRLRRLQLKYKMHVLTDELEKEALSKGFDIKMLDDESDTESEHGSGEQNTPELGDDVCLDDLTDSDMSDLDETEKPRLHRATRGTRCLTIKRNNKGETQLHQACIAGNVELVRRLLDQGHVVNVRDHAGWIPLHEACNHGFRDIVELLLDRGAAVAINDKGGTSCDGITPLYDACSNGLLDVVELLLERGADATVKTDFGETCVNGLDKWRRSATLTEGEQAQYTQLRAALLKPLSKVGLCNSKEAALRLTNANVEKDTNSIENEKTTSPTTTDDEDDELHTSGSATLRRTELNRSNDSAKTRKDINRTSQRTTAPTASFEYKHVMQQLKHPNRPNTLDDDFPCSSFSAASLKQKRMALLDSQEVDVDNWLIDDIGPEKKKRRYHTPTNDARGLSKENLHDSANGSWQELASTLTPDADAYQILFDAAGGQVATNSQARQKQARKLRFSRSSSFGSNSSGAVVASSKQKNQASLLDSGFCRFRSESPLSSEELTQGALHLHMHTTEPDSTTATPIHLTLISPSKSSPLKMHATPTVLSTTVSFKIKVEDELLLIPVERKKLKDINIRWLAEEAARRYYNLIGLKPNLRLKTADGFAYEENDPVAVAIEQNMLMATVLEWKIAPLPQRYSEMCHQLNKTINSDIQTALERAQLSNAIHLEDFWLTATQTEPIFKALLHQTNLHVLDLANNFIQNEGCRQLAKSLQTLKHLKTLNLKGNFITSEGLDILCCSTISEKLVDLEELDLSQNPLGNSCVRILDKFCNSAAGKSLQKLSLSHCNLTNLYDFDLCFYQLNSFDISYNQLTAESLLKLISKLNSCRLQYLNLSYTRALAHTSSQGEHIVALLESGTCEKFKRLELAGCNLSDINIYKLVQHLSKAKDLELLDITDNVKLSGSSLHYILEELPQLRKLIATNCRHLIDVERIEKLINLKHMPNFMALTLTKDTQQVDAALESTTSQLRSMWQAHWGDKAYINSYADQLQLYLNEQDLSLIS